MPLCLHPAYFPNILTLAFVVHGNVLWEVWDNYQKQTYRNRCHICTDRGLLKLTVPIQHAGGDQGRQAYRNVRIDNSSTWQRQHWRGLQTAYRTSPYFEFYEDDLAPLFEKRFTYLMEMNFQIMSELAAMIGFSLPEERTESYMQNIIAMQDGRFLVNAKGSPLFELEPYRQVFSDRHGFIPNLSVLDLLFNLGPESLAYLKRQARNWDQSSFPALKR